MTGLVSPAGPSAPARRAARRWTGARIAGTLFLGFWTASGIALLAYLVFRFDGEFYAKYGPKLLDGLLVTVQIVTLSILIGAVVSLPVALGRLSTKLTASIPAYGFVYFFRGTPLIAQTFLIYYGAGSFRVELEAVGLWWFFRDAFNCVILTFSLNTAAYQAEILRGSIKNVPKGQREAGEALGLHKTTIYRKIILPQALIVALRPYGNEIILMIKGSAIASIVTVLDLMGETRRAFSRTFEFQTYIWAAILYFLLVEVLRRILNRVDLRVTQHLKRDTTSTS